MPVLKMEGQFDIRNYNVPCQTVENWLLPPPCHPDTDEMTAEQEEKFLQLVAKVRELAPSHSPGALQNGV